MLLQGREKEKEVPRFALVMLMICKNYSLCCKILIRESPCFIGNLMLFSTDTEGGVWPLFPLCLPWLNGFWLKIVKSELFFHFFSFGLLIRGFENIFNYPFFLGIVHHSLLFEPSGIKAAEGWSVYGLEARMDLVWKLFPLIWSERHPVIFLLVWEIMWSHAAPV